MNLLFQSLIPFFFFLITAQHGGVERLFVYPRRTRIALLNSLFFVGKKKLDRYSSEAAKLLKAAAKGENPLEGFVPSVPNGVTLEVGSPKFSDMEAKGVEEVQNSAFVLVAGGLGGMLVLCLSPYAFFFLNIYIHKVYLFSIPVFPSGKEFDTVE